MTSDKAYDVEQRLNALVAARRTFTASSPLTLSASYQTVPGLAAALDAAEYHVRAQILVNPTVSGGTPSYQYNGSGGLALSHGRLTITELYAVSNVSADYAGDAALPAALTSVGSVGAGLLNRLVTFDGYLNVTTAGTLNIQAKLSSGSGSIVQYGSYLETGLLS